jgi:hypothetical protein
MTRLFEISAGKEHELILSLQKAGMTLEDANHIIGNWEVSEAVVSTLRPFRSLDDFTKYLRPLDEQLTMLWGLNRQMYREDRIPSSWFDDVWTPSDHIQSLDDLEFLFVAKNSVEATLVYNWWLIKKAQPGHFDYGLGLGGSGGGHFGAGDNTGTYQPGIHRLRINLVDNWPPKDQFANRDQFWEWAAKSDKMLAGAEVLGAYSLQDPTLLGLQDGKNLPFCNLAGLRLMDRRYEQRDDYITCLKQWVKGGPTLSLNSNDDEDSEFATPTLVEA